MEQPEGFFFPLDPMQRPAVEAAEGVSLVTGGTGTGKTHVMVARVAYWLNEGVDPGHITCLAARGEAAADLRYRLGCHPRTWGHLDDIFVGTIHEYANVFLRRAGAAVLRRSPEYTIWDRRRAVEAVRIAWSDHYETGLRKRETEEALDWYWRNREASCRSLLPIRPCTASGWMWRRCTRRRSGCRVRWTSWTCWSWRSGRWSGTMTSGPSGVPPVPGTCWSTRSRT